MFGDLYLYINDKLWGKKLRTVAFAKKRTTTTTTATNNNKKNNKAFICIFFLFIKCVCLLCVFVRCCFKSVFLNVKSP